jgi:hypothetical protein
MGEVAEQVEIAADPDAVWALVGDFQGLHLWHPHIAASTAENSGLARRLVLHNGAVLLEQQLMREESTRRLAYAIVESPLPLRRHEAEMSVTPMAGGSVVRWQCRYEAAEGADGEVAEIFRGVFRDGFEALKAKFQPFAKTTG